VPECLMQKLQFFLLTNKVTVLENFTMIKKIRVIHLIESYDDQGRKYLVVQKMWNQVLKNMIEY